MISMLGVILAKSRESSWPAIIQISCPLSDKNYLLILMFDCPVSQGLASGIKKIVGLWIFSSNYEILEPFFMSLEVLFLWVSRALIFWPCQFFREGSNWPV